jgi:multidrug efflux system membrane fusion protein
VFLALRFGRHKNVSLAANATDQPIIIHAAAAQRGDMGVYIDALGTVTPISTVNIYSQVSGQIFAVHLTVNPEVHAPSGLVPKNGASSEGWHEQWV